MFEPTTIAHIDLSALSSNLSQIKTITPNSKILAMIKCNAYGHGLAQIAEKIFPDVDALGLMFLREALELKEFGFKKPVVV